VSLPDHLIGENVHGRYCVPRASMSRPAAAAAIKGRVWEERTIALIAHACGGGDIVHAGAYFGDFLPALSKALAPGARLWTFEPSRENHACAEETVRLNGLDNVSLFHAALGQKEGSAVLRTVGFLGEALGGSSEIVDREDVAPGCESVPVVALDDVIDRKRNVTVIHLDVEGYEQKALRGARKTIKSWWPLLVLESLPRSAEWHERNIAGLGYRAVGEVHGNTVLTTAEDAPAGFAELRDDERVVARRERRERE
jgi:FkbM family methyltransferase